MSDDSLDDIVSAAKNGDQEAWNRLVDRYIPLVMGVIRRYKLSPEDAADVNQTLWLRLVEHLDRIREPHAIPGWIVTTTKNEALRLLKMRNRSLPVDPLTGFGLEATGAPDVDQDLLLEERRRVLRDGLAELPPRHRDLLMLLIAEPPLSYDEISERLQMRKGSIGPTRARYLAELRATRAFRSFLATSDAEVGRS